MGLKLRRLVHSAADSIHCAGCVYDFALRYCPASCFMSGLKLVSPALNGLRSFRLIANNNKVCAF